MTKELHYILPQEARATTAVFAGHQLAWEFHREREARHAQQRYCQWYRETAQQQALERQQLQRQQQFLRRGLSALVKGRFRWHRHS